MNKFNKGKVIGLACASLAAVSLVGVGFSSWVISTKNTETIGNVYVAVADTIDKRITISEANVSDKTINFDCNKDDTFGDIQFSGTGDGEDLSFTITYNVTLGSNLPEGEYQGIQAYYTMGTDSSESGPNKTFSSLLGNNYFTMPIGNSSDKATKISDGTKTKPADNKNLSTASNVTTTISTVSSNPTVISYSSTFSLAWGSFFNGYNPGECLEGNNNKNKRTVDEVITALQELYTASTATFTVTLAPISSTTSSN